MSIYPTHKHHIVPKHAGGTDDPFNLVELTVEDHAIAHKVLYGLYGRWQDKLAWLGLSGSINDQERIREIAVNAGKANKGRSRPDLKCKSYFGASADAIVAGIEKMRQKKTGMKVNYPKNRKSSPCSIEKAKKISEARLETLDKYVKMSKSEFKEWLVNKKLRNERGKLNGNITRAIKARGECVTDYFNEV